MTYYTVAKDEVDAIAQVTTHVQTLNSFLVENSQSNLEDRILALRDVDPRFAERMYEVTILAKSIRMRCRNGHSSGWHMGLACTRCGDID